MLTVESYAPGGTQPQCAQASRVLIRDGAGNPVCVAVVYDAGVVLLSTLDDPEFPTMLRTFGISEGPETLTRIIV